MKESKVFVDWVLSNKEWLFSGVGIIVIVGLAKLMMHKNNGKSLEPVPATSMKQSSSEANGGEGGRGGGAHVNITNNLINNGGAERGQESLSEPLDTVDLDKLKSKTRILFVDDEPGFTAVDILKGAGWINTESIADVDNLDHPRIKDGHIFFIDIQGVGKAMGFKDEGLGLARAIKERFPAKKVVIYSAQTRGNRFDPTFELCDGRLPKNAEPYQFQVQAEKLASEIQF